MTGKVVGSRDYLRLFISLVSFLYRGYESQMTPTCYLDLRAPPLNSTVRRLWHTKGEGDVLWRRPFPNLVLGLHSHVKSLRTIARGRYLILRSRGFLEDSSSPLISRGSVLYHIGGYRGFTVILGRGPGEFDDAPSFRMTLFKSLQTTWCHGFVWNEMILNQFLVQVNLQELHHTPFFNGRS